MSQKAVDTLPSQYDWSDLDVGNIFMDDSEHFFDKHHPKHERKEQPDDKQRLQQQQRLLEQQRRDYVVKDAELCSAALAKHMQLEVNRSKLMAKSVPPQAYRFKDIYEQNKRQLIGKCLAQERKMREFHSRPMPNFELVHQQQQQVKPTMHRITNPLTPNVLRTSLIAQQKQRQKIEQFVREREEEEMNMHKRRARVKPTPTPTPRPKPKHVQCLFMPRQQLEVKPFKFNTEQRAEQRKLFNAQALKTLELKRQQLEEQRRQRDWELYQKQRQLATFRARPNPFKSSLDLTES